MSNLTVRPINTGFVTMIPKQYLYHHSTVAFYPEASDQEEEYPVFTYLVEGGGKLLLVDTGMAYTERADKYHHHGSHQPEGMSIVEQLAALGYKPEEIDIVVFTHLHWDHCFYMKKFTNAEFYVNKKEYEFAMNPIPLYFKSYEAPELGITRPFEGIAMNLVEGDTEIMPGVRVFETPGHSVGHQSVEIDTAAGRYICCGDSIFIMDNVKPIEELHYDITPPNRFSDIVASWKSIERIKERAEGPDKILTCHDREMLVRAAVTPVLGLEREGR
ncbi:Zn-dependent hydrolases%2C including glyoxylases [[Clostridium] symbiosum]|uniref:N-acyl homoserine lactonase family protein n=1 Tax=Clostridium symbiosum TaxID=1512 RepID=UPI0006C3F682|nr:N-acyl homoserine lactonase family protein [[Clostridium] symbiosum]CUP11302.1 Zn-dependent hydrolases%2C including glyoxylases [[Clostridium] symbiosum]